MNVPGSRKPSIYIPTLYFAEGLPFALVNMMSTVFFKNLGATNQFIGLTSFLYLPWACKFLWAPLVDILSTKRQWILLSQITLAILVGLLSFSSLSSLAIPAALVLFSLIALASATQDIAIDGFYLDALDKSGQAFYVGVRNAAYKLAWLLGAGGLTYLAGCLGQSAGIAVGWSLGFGLCAVLFALLWIFHANYLPQTQAPLKKEESLDFAWFFQVTGSYFRQRRIAAIVFYILTFRLGDALMLKMAQPFLLDAVEHGGLNMSTADVGLVYGTAGTIFLLLGGILGGWLIGRDGLKKWLWPTALIQNLAILLYWYLAWHKPNLFTVAVVNSVEQFSYGLGVAAYTVFLLSTVNTSYRASHYALATALMAFGMMLPGAISGYLQAHLGYSNFFLLSFFASIPGIIVIFFLPIENSQQQTGSNPERQ